MCVIRTTSLQPRKMELERCDSTNDGDSEIITNDNSKAITCPLFMDGLPGDFSTNPALAAIASLMNDDGPTTGITNDDDDDITAVTATKKSPTKKVITKRSERTKYKPYNKINRATILTCDEYGSRATATREARQCDQTASDNNSDIENKSRTTTIGEASLFLKMWKL